MSMPIPPYSADIGPVPNITPFTYRDGRTYLDKLAGLVYWANNSLVPQMNEAVEIVINDGIQLQDPVMAGIIGTDTSLTNSATVEAIENNETPIGGALTNRFTRIEPKDINARIEGVSPSNTAIENTEIFNSIVLNAPEGSRIFVPYFDEPILINGPITFTKALHFEGLGGRAKISQTVWGNPIFDILNADGSSIKNFELAMIPDKQLDSTPFRDGNRRIYACGVWAAANRLEISNLFVNGFTSGIRLTNWRDNIQARSGFMEDCTFENIYVTNVDWGVVGTGWRRVEVRSVYGDFSLTPGSTDPSHLLYVSSGQLNEDIIIRDMIAYDSSGGHAYSVRATNGLTAESLSVRNGVGLITIDSVKNAKFRNLMAFNDTASGDGSVYMFGTNEQITIESLFIEVVNSGRPIRFAGNMVKLIDAFVKVNRATNLVNGEIFVDVNNGEIINSYVQNIGAGSNVGIFVSSTSNKLSIIGGGGEGLATFTTITAGAIDTSVEYDPKRTARRDIPGARTVSNASAITSSKIKPNKSVVNYISGTGESVQIRADECTHAIIMVNGAAAFTISNPVEPFLGAEITVQIINNTAGALGNITWGSGWNLSGFVAPTAGQVRTITFLYNGTSWREISRA